MPTPTLSASMLVSTIRLAQDRRLQPRGPAVKIAQCVENFVARKRVCGYEYDSSARILRRFAAFVGRIDIALDSEENINLFLTRGHLAHHTWRSQRSLIRRFVAYWFARRQINRIPESEQKPNIRIPFFPYLSSTSEIPN